MAELLHSAPRLDQPDAPQPPAPAPLPSATPGATSRPPDIICQLWFEQFKQYAWLAVTAAGGTLLLLQSGFLAASVQTGGAVAAFSLSAGTAVIGQEKLVDHITVDRGIGNTIRAFRLASGLLLGVGLGLLAAAVSR